MKIGIYSYKDNVNGFMAPCFDVTEAGAVRGFAFAVNQPGLINFKPEDYSLWYLGCYDSDTGVIESEDPRLIVHATEVIQKNDKKKK